MTRSTQTCSGFTLLEVAIAATLFGVILIGTVTATLSTKQAFEGTTARNALDVRARRALDRIVDEFNTAGVSGLSPVPTKPLGSDNLSYKRPTGLASGAVTWDSAARIQFERSKRDLDNGKDDDRNGIVDDGQVVLIQRVGLKNQNRTVLAVDVPEFAPGEVGNGKDDNQNGLTDERGLSFVLAGSVLTIRLAILGRDAEGNTITSTQEASIRLRN